MADDAGACDFHLNRVRQAIDAGLTACEIANVLSLPTTTQQDSNWNPVEQVTRLVEWRRGQGNAHTAWWNLSIKERREQATMSPKLPRAEVVAEIGGSRLTLTDEGAALAEKLLEECHDERSSKDTA